MVQFGKRLELLKRAGWESDYVQYEALKELVAKLEKAPSDDEKSALSEQFCKSLSNDILHVSAFYVEKLEKARDAVEKLRLQESINVDKYLKAPGEGPTTFVGAIGSFFWKIEMLLWRPNNGI